MTQKLWSLPGSIQQEKQRSTRTAESESER